jgi:hypothetical protein
MGELTRRQHYVPAFYLEQWAIAGHVTLHNLANDTWFGTNPINALVQSWFYEEDPDNPDNRIEKLLSVIDGRAAPVFRKLNELNTRKGEHLGRAVRHFITGRDHDVISEFAAYQYMRVPGAIALKAKEYELRGLTVSDDGGVPWLNPGRFVEEGYRRVAARFREMNLMLLVTPGPEFITSDIPCFDFGNSRNLPMLGDELGIDPDVCVTFPLSPKVCAHFLHAEFNPGHDERIMVVMGSPRLVRNLNSAQVERCEKFVVATQRQDFIFKVAAKRVRGRPA